MEPDLPNERKNRRSGNWKTTEEERSRSSSDFGEIRIRSVM
jgi:hypothetical protein